MLKVLYIYPKLIVEFLGLKEIAAPIAPAYLPSGWVCICLPVFSDISSIKYGV